MKKVGKILLKVLKVFLSVIAVLLVLALIVIGVLGAYQHSTKGDYTVVEANGASNYAFADSFKEVKNYPKTKTVGRYWRDGMIGGNGHYGFVTSGSPYSDTIIYQDVDYIMPSDRDRYDLPDLTVDLERCKQSVVNLDDSFEAAGCGPWNYGYAFHPGQQLRLTQDAHTFYKNYARWTNYDTGEVGVTYTDKNGTWVRKTFTSHEDDTTITSIQKSSKDAKINMTISLDDASGMYKFGVDDGHDERNMLYKKIVADDCSSITHVAHYPDYELSSLGKGGYAGVTYVLTVGGSKEKVQLDAIGDEAIIVGDKNPAIKITDADAVYLITANGRTFDMGDFSAFADAKSYELVDQLMAECKATVDSYSDANGFSYDSAVEKNAEKQMALMDCATLDLNATNKERHMSNEKLLRKQRTSKEVNSALMERLYEQATYAVSCSSGYTMTRLSGMWTGEWYPGWRSEYTMDANVNLQSSGMNTAGTGEFGIGYIKFILRQIDDWKTNAKQSYGMDNAIMAPVNCDGDGALGAEYAHSYPFQYWNAGASWMLQPIYEFYQCYGDATFTYDDGKEMSVLNDVLLPLLTLQSNFWDQLVSPEYYTDADGNAKYEKGKKTLNNGEKYLIVPSYSPENTTGGEVYNSTIAANSAIDIAAARSGIQMTIDVENATKTAGYKNRVEYWQSLLSKLPDYQYDDTGAIKEWCANQYEDNNKHRHISHLYCAWPLMETQDNEELAKACLQALDNREKENSASHGFVHQALVSARLKQGDRVYDLIHGLMKSRICYDSLMTDHNTNRGSDTYCTDTELGMIGIVNESILCSDTGRIDILPALPEKWSKGAMNGLMARTQARVNVEWDNGKAKATIVSSVEQKIIVSCAGDNEQEITLKPNQEITLEFNY